MKSILSVFLLCLFSLRCTRSANILVVSPTVSKSHYVMFGVLSRALAGRGHNVTQITTFPEVTTTENLTEISVKSVRTVFLNNLPVEMFGVVPPSFLTAARMLLVYVDSTANVLNFTDVRRLMTSESEKFDLVISESFVDDVFLGFAYKFEAPVITVSSCYMHAWTADRFAVPSDPAYIPGFHSGYGVRMRFWQRLRNALLDAVERLFFRLFLEPRQTAVVREYFGADYPSVGHLVRNISLYFINTPSVLYGTRPYPPQVVDISGIHLQQTKPLSQVVETGASSPTFF